MLAIGPWLMDLVFGGDFDYERGGLVLVSIGMGLYLSAATLNQALLAHGRARAGLRARGSRCAVAFALFLLLAEFDDRVLQVEIAFLGAAAALCALLWLALPARLTSFSHGLSPGRGPRTGLRARRHRRQPSASPSTAASAWCCSSTPATTRRSARASSAPTATRPRASTRWRRPSWASPTQSVESHRDWTAKHGLTVPLLADPGGEGRQGLRRPPGAARHHAGGGDRRRARGASATATTTCSGSTSRRSTTCATRSTSMPRARA